MLENNKNKYKKEIMLLQKQIEDNAEAAKEQREKMKNK